jgi:glycosyltransferase involved in cell wall biosynthesis
MISVCMATYNGESFIKEQLTSILCQLGDNDEIVITDDASTDKTVDIITNIKDKRIKLSINPKNFGVIYSFNLSLENSKGDIIFLSDQDDIWLESKVDLCVTRLRTYDLIVTNCYVTDENLNVIQNSFFSCLDSGAGIIKNFYKNTYVGCCMAFNRKILKEVLPIPRGLMMYHDAWIGMISNIKYSVFFEKRPLLLFRRYPGNSSSSTEKSSNGLVFKVFSRVQLFFLILRRMYFG